MSNSVELDNFLVIQHYSAKFRIPTNTKKVSAKFRIPTNTKKVSAKFRISYKHKKGKC